MRPATSNTRPMPDRVKEAIFSILGSHYRCPGRLPALQVADVFAGSGSMGLEALSRGAAGCCFFERDRTALTALKRNLASLDLQNGMDIITRDAWSASVVECSRRKFELILLDPPYRDAYDVTESGVVRRYLARIRETRAGAEPLILLHHPSSVCFELEPDEGWRILKTRSFGTNAMTIFDS